MTHEAPQLTRLPPGKAIKVSRPETITWRKSGGFGSDRESEDLKRYGRDDSARLSGCLCPMFLARKQENELSQAKKRQYCDNDDDGSDQPNDAIHGITPFMTDGLMTTVIR
jgi:hypothetical protein